MYSDIKQGEHETTDQLDQCIKDLVERCQYDTENEKTVCQTELLFHATKHFEVKKWVRSKKNQEEVTYKALLQYAKEHKMMVKDFNWHKVQWVELPQQQPLMRSRPSNSRKAMATEARVAWVRHAANAAHLTCPENAQHGARNVTKCGNKNHFSTCCRSKQKIPDRMARNLRGSGREHIERLQR